jgi:hypothetical protein
MWKAVHRTTEVICGRVRMRSGGRRVRLLASCAARVVDLGLNGPDARIGRAERRVSPW